MQILPKRRYINSVWLKETDEKFSDFVTDLINDEVSMASVMQNGETLHTTHLEISDCYFDENGNLLVPSVYILTDHGGYRDEAQVWHDDTEYYPDSYEVFKTNEQIKTEFKEWAKDH